MGEVNSTTKDKWNEIISKKLKAGQSIDDLKYTYDSGIVMDPNIVAEEVEGLDYYIDNLKPWINMAAIHQTDSSVVNRLAMTALNQGANGLYIILDEKSDVSIIFKDILTEYLQVTVDCSRLSSAKIKEQKSLLSPTKFPNVAWICNVEHRAIHISHNDRTQSLRSALQEVNSESQYTITVSMSKNILFEIASLRALKIMLQERDISNCTIIARYDVDGDNSLGDYNLIERTYKVMSGILGCADYVITDYDGSEESRLTLNIHNILDLESGFKDVLDPVGGSFYIEKLTSKIIQRVLS